MNKMAWLLLVIPVLFTLGCASPAKTGNMVYASGYPSSYDPALKKQIEIWSAPGGEKTNPLWTSEISTEAFCQAVRTSLIIQGLFSENGRYQLQIIMRKTGQPLFGANLTVTTCVNYILTDRSDDTVVFNETISAPYTATVGDAFLAVQRLRLANEGSGKENIKGFLERLSKLRITADRVSLVE